MQNKLIDPTHILNEKITVYPDTVAPKFVRESFKFMTYTEEQG